MGFVKKYVGDLQISNRWYILMAACTLLFFVAFLLPFLFRIAFTMTMLVFFFTIVDYVLLFVVNGGLTGNRDMQARFSIGEYNIVSITVVNSFPFKVSGFLIDELPPQFQKRDFRLELSVPLQSHSATAYELKPLSRGEYNFGQLLYYASSPLGLMERRFDLA